MKIRGLGKPVPVNRELKEGRESGPRCVLNTARQTQHSFFNRGRVTVKGAIESGMKSEEKWSIGFQVAVGLRRDHRRSN